MQRFTENKISLYFIIILFSINTQFLAQIDTRFNTTVLSSEKKLNIGGQNPIFILPEEKSFFRSVSFAEYIHLVGENNLEYAAEKFNINIAEANALSTRIFPDPELSLTTWDNGQYRMQMGYGFSTGFSYTLELGGKRKARINLAKSETELAQLLLADYFRNLRADATKSYLDAILQKKIMAVKMNSYQTMKQLSDSDSIRLQLGAITEIDARQTNLEANLLLNEIYQQEADWKTALIELSFLTGTKQLDTLYYPISEFEKFEREFNLNELISKAKENRTDLAAALKSKDVSEKNLQLARANRVIDLGISLGAEQNSLVTNSIAPSPSFTTISAGLTIPLRFSNNNKGELNAAQYIVEQRAITYKQIELQVQTEASQHYYNYLAMKKQVQQFTSGMLENAEKILNGKIYSYQRGETSLLEVLNAQHTYNEVQENYFRILNALSTALVELERVVGIWDINF